VSLKVNVIANYAGQLYMTVINLLIVPIYLRYMGAEAYGLVGVFAMLQMLFQLLDMGLTPTMSREASRFAGGATDTVSLRKLLRALECVFALVAAAGAAAIISGTDAIAMHWLKADGLPVNEVRHAVMLMALLVALRWISGLYRGTISGLERQVWLNGFNVAVVTSRSVLVIPVFVLVGSSPTIFFSFQFIVAFAETCCLARQAYKLLPLPPGVTIGRWDWRPIRGVLSFSVSIAFTSSVWILITQTDKLVLSKLLPLADYGYFTLAVLAAGGVMLLSLPIATALQPRLSKVAASSDDEGLVRTYRFATQLTGVLAAPAILLLAFFPEQVLWVWTGNAVVVSKASRVLSLYALGNGLLIFSAFPYYLQFAKGDVKLHVIGNAIMSVLLIPALLFATTRFGMNGAGYAWLGCNMAYFILWVPLVHQRLFKGLHTKWLWTDVALTQLPALGMAIALHQSVTWPSSRLSVAALLCCIGLILLSISATCSGWMRDFFFSRWHSRRLATMDQG
jgi:O-antigen/teichoic acid export membrane protein